jgi:hypothetical protein
MLLNHGILGGKYNLNLPMNENHDRKMIVLLLLDLADSRSVFLMANHIFCTCRKAIFPLYLMSYLRCFHMD